MLVEDINLNTRVFLWPLDMEETIDLTLKTLNTKKNMAEEKLRSWKAIFEDKLKKHEKDLELFRRFDPPLLNLDLLKDVVDRVDGIYRNLMVSGPERRIPLLVALYRLSMYRLLSSHATRTSVTLRGYQRSARERGISPHHTRAVCTREKT